MLRVLFFGRLRDLAGAAELEVAAAPETLAELRVLVSADNPRLAEALAEPSTRVAIDRAFAAGDAPTASAREVAFMPPLSGG